MIALVLLLVALLGALPPRGHAGQGQADPTDAGTRQSSAGADAGTQQAPPLSPEDADVVKQLAVLEDVDLLRNLDLFEPSSGDSSGAADGGMARDAGNPDTGAADAGNPNTGAADAANPDTGAAAAAKLDAGAADAAKPDPGAADSGAADAGTPAGR
jgi:hypothetical protein